MDYVRAAVANHREHFRRAAERRERVGGIDLLVAGRRGMLPFPRSSTGSDELVARIRRLRLLEVGAWSAGEDATLGTRLVARGFQWGWQPHWMGLDLARLPDEEPSLRVEAPGGPAAEGLPYGAQAVPGERELVVRERGVVVGRARFLPWRGVLGIYDVGVVPPLRRRGLGRALTLAACRAGRELGCTHAVLNSTGEGEPLYRGLGFASYGHGRTWWWFPRRPPTARRIALVEAAGFGDLDALARLRPRSPERVDLLAHAVCTNRVDTASWLLDRYPALVRAAVDPGRGATLLHVAVEWDSAALVRLALARGADPEARDTAFGATPAEWAAFFGRPSAILQP